MGGIGFHETVRKSDFKDPEKAYEFLCREADEATKCDYEEEGEDYSCDDQLYNGTISTTCGFFKVTPPKVEQKKTKGAKKKATTKGISKKSRDDDDLFKTWYSDKLNQCKTGDCYCYETDGEWVFFGIAKC